ncbi:MAG TPA: hypothetical protein VF914_14465 [Chloroflexia bacterium]|jgi:hydrogenase/urease accessory protein HupE
MSNKPPERPDDEHAYRQLYSLLSGGQGIYYALTGLWAIVNIGTFQKVTGSKVDIWLVKTVGVLIIVIGAVLGLAGKRGEPVPEVPLLAVGSAAGLTAIDVIYVAKKRIRPVYLLDALAEVGLIGLWGIWSGMRPRDRR